MHEGRGRILRQGTTVGQWTQYVYLSRRLTHSAILKKDAGEKLRVWKGIVDVGGGGGNPMLVCAGARVRVRAGDCMCVRFCFVFWGFHLPNGSVSHDISVVPLKSKVSSDNLFSVCN